MEDLANLQLMREDTAIRFAAVYAYHLAVYAEWNDPEVEFHRRAVRAAWAAVTPPAGF